LGDLARLAAKTATAFVRATLDEPEVAEGMLAWLHSGFSVHDSVWLDQDDVAAHDRLAQ